MVGWETSLVGNRNKRMDVLKRLWAFLLFANSPVAPCTSHISLLDHILLHLLFLRSVVGWGVSSVTVTSSEPERERLMERRRKKITL